jgi:uncharacterized protein (UPF0210 family)
MSFVRTITLGFDPEAAAITQRERDLPVFFERAENAVRAAGRTLRTRRLLLPELNTRPRFSRTSLEAILRWVEGVADAAGVRWFNVPFSTFTSAGADLTVTFEAALDVVRRHPNAFVNFIVAQHGKIEPRGVLETARFIHAVSRQSRNGYDNFRVGASCNVAAGGPFFPFTHHAGDGDAFSVALELPAAFLEVISAHQREGLPAIRDALVARMVTELREVDAIGRVLEAESGTRYLGIDASLAPYPDETGSVARLFELLGVDDYGSSGTLFVTGYLTDVLRTAIAQSGARTLGFNGVMHSLLEDPAIAERSSRRTLGIDALLSFASMCGCGLDMVPIPGDTYVEEIASLILDVAGLSTALGKPLGARILPIPGKHANEYTDFGHDFFFNCRILAVRNRACRERLFLPGAFGFVTPRVPSGGAHDD